MTTADAKSDFPCVTSMLHELGWQQLASGRKDIRLVGFIKLCATQWPSSQMVYLLRPIHTLEPTINTNFENMRQIVMLINFHSSQELLLNGILSPRTSPRLQASPSWSSAATRQRTLQLGGIPPLKGLPNIHQNQSQNKDECSLQNLEMWLIMFN